jgi:hypothetical protein
MQMDATQTHKRKDQVAKMVKRYVTFDDSKAVMREWSGGPWVKASDYDALMALAKERAEFINGIHRNRAVNTIKIWQVADPARFDVLLRTDIPDYAVSVVHLSDYNTLAAELAASERYRANLAQGHVDQADRIRALEAALAEVGRTCNGECGCKGYQYANGGLPQAETACGEKPPIGFGVPSLADRVKAVMAETGAGYESALQTVAEECELRSEAIFAVRQYFDHYEPEQKNG